MEQTIRWERMGDGSRPGIGMSYLVKGYTIYQGKQVKELRLTQWHSHTLGFVEPDMVIEYYARIEI